MNLGREASEEIFCSKRLAAEREGAKCGCLGLRTVISPCSMSLPVCKSLTFDIVAPFFKPDTGSFILDLEGWISACLTGRFLIPGLSIVCDIAIDFAMRD